MEKKERKRRVKAAHRRNQVLDAAKAVFLDRDYHTVTMEEIAEEAGLSRATVYQYSSGKQDLYTAVLVRDLSKLVDGLRESFIEDDPIKSNMYRMAMEYMKFFKDHTEYFKSMSFYFMPGRKEELPADTATIVRAKLDEGITAIERAITCGIERLEVRPMDARAATLALWGQWMGCAYLSAAGRLDIYERTVEQVYTISTDIFLEGMLLR